MNAETILHYVRAVADAARRDDPAPPIDAVEQLAAQVLIDLHRIADALEMLAARPR